MNYTMSFFKMPSRLLRTTGIGLASFIFLTVPTLSHAAVLERQLQVGMSGADVSALQTFLAQDRSIYPQGLVTGYFGILTSAAVSNFQSRNGIDNVGRVGPITLARINAQMAGGMTTGGDIMAPVISGVSVSVAGTFATVSWNTNENAKGTVYYGTSPLTEFELPHSVTISGSVAMTDANMRTGHAVMLSGLQPNTTYYYDAYVTDAAGNASMTMQSSFRTTN